MKPSRVLHHWHATTMASNKTLRYVVLSIRNLSIRNLSIRNLSVHYLDSLLPTDPSALIFNNASSVRKYIESL